MTTTTTNLRTWATIAEFDRGFEALENPRTGALHMTEAEARACVAAGAPTHARFGGMYEAVIAVHVVELDRNLLLSGAGIPGFYACVSAARELMAKSGKPTFEHTFDDLMPAFARKEG